MRQNQKMCGILQYEIYWGHILQFTCTFISFHCERWMSCCMAIQENDCAPREYSDKPEHLHNLIRVITVRMKKPWILIAAHWAHSEDACQTGWMPRLIWVFAGCTDHFACFCHVLAEMVLMNTCGEEIAILSFSLMFLLKHLTYQDLFTEVNVDLVDNDQCYTFISYHFFFRTSRSEDLTDLLTDENDCYVTTSCSASPSHRRLRLRWETTLADRRRSSPSQGRTYLSTDRPTDYR